MVHQIDVQNGPKTYKKMFNFFHNNSNANGKYIMSLLTHNIGRKTKA